MKVPLRPLIALAIISFTFVTAVRSHTATSAVSQWNRIDVSGTYSVTGTGGNGQYYEGELFIRRQGDVYQLHWNAGNQYDGIGVVNGNVLAVAYTDSDIEPDDCGVVSYRILGNGTLDGISGMYGENETEPEKAVRVSGTGLVGSYNLTGVGAGGNYKGTLSITAKGSGYNIQTNKGWGGFGFRRGNILSVVFGGEQCEWVSYEIKAGGVLDGAWGAQGTSTPGTERAVKQ
jgi:hypothetical protein